MRTVGRAGVIIGVLAAWACGGQKPDAFEGPLARAADTAASYDLGCVSTDHWPMVPGQPPFRDCRGGVGDTSIVVVADASNTVMLVARKWSVGDEGDGAFSSAVRGLRETLGWGDSVPPSDEDNLDRQLFVWSFPGYYLSLRYMPAESSIYLVWQLGSPER